MRLWLSSPRTVAQQISEECFSVPDDSTGEDRTTGLNVFVIPSTVELDLKKRRSPRPLRPPTREMFKRQPVQPGLIEDIEKGSYR
jgi:hypothetical protein